MKHLVLIALFAIPFSESHDIFGQVPDASPTAEQVYVMVQEICPVSGQPLGNHGLPIKATVGKSKEQVFLCCKGCLGKKIAPKHWDRIHANFLAAQQQCPVMRKPLPKNPAITIANGRPIYTCCPPCVKKITNDPESFIRKVDSLYLESLQANEDS